MFEEEEIIISKPQQVRRFYFLDYFFILLQSCEVENNWTDVFVKFKDLKDRALLGESKYKKLTLTNEDLTERQARRYQYTFNQVIAESSEYKLVSNVKDKIIISGAGLELLEIGKKDRWEFNLSLFQLMEKKFNAFYHLINFCYENNTEKNGVLIFPVYSPLKLGYKKNEMIKTQDWLDYIQGLKKQLTKNIDFYLNKRIDLEAPNQNLIDKLTKDEIINSNDPSSDFIRKNYNALIGRIRKFWLNYFLKEIYNYQYSFDTFNIWAERGKQLGIIHTSEVYPDLDGRIIYPTSIISDNSINQDLIKIFRYPNRQALFIHKPTWQQPKINELTQFQEQFIQNIQNTYYDLKNKKRSQFIRISDLREKICYKMRIPQFVFNEFLEKTYELNLKGELKYQISLEADRLPSETNAMYLKREPVIVRGEPKNIISINYNHET